MKKESTHKTQEWQKEFSVSWNTTVHNLKSTGVDLSKILLAIQEETQNR